MTPEAERVHQRYLDLLDEIEARFDVAGWRCGDVDLWPPARIDLFLDLFRASGAETERPAPPLLQRIGGGLAAPLTNAWKSRGDLEHWLAWPRRADAIVLGDGVTLDRTGGAWRDRYGEPVMAALDRQGRSTFLMQPGGLKRLPWARPTFAANTIAVRGALGAALGPKTPVDLPDHAAVLEFLQREGAAPPSLTAARLSKRGRTIAAAASAFQHVLRVVQPRLAFAVTSYAGLGHAFALACRREGLLSIDLQHCPHGGAPRAYRWAGLPERGYSTLPAVFWTWTPEEAAKIGAWGSPWHVPVHGGHSHLADYLDSTDAVVLRADERFAAVGDGAAFEREILVALQPIGGRRIVWEALAGQIAAAPRSWRWWIRRHPSSTAFQDAEYQSVLALRGPNVVVEAASELPLPALLRRMSVVVSLASGASTEAAAFGVPAFFVGGEALALFPGLIERGEANLIDIADLAPRIASLPHTPTRAAGTRPPPIADTLMRLDRMAADYSDLCRTEPLISLAPSPKIRSSRRMPGPRSYGAPV
jgi:hypothetical protein